MERPDQRRDADRGFPVSEGLTETGQRGGRNAWADLACCAAIIATALVLGLPQIGTGGLGWSDAPNHTFDGIFVLEFLRAWPVGLAREWAEQFYLHHPSLGIFVYYPPGFAVVEAAMFACFGVSIAVARFTILLYAIAASLMMFDLGRRWFGRWSGLFAALILLSCPHGFAWLNDVMLEWPATFWILTAVYAYEKDRESRRIGWSIGLGIAIVGAFLTKQTAAFILPVVILHAILQKDVSYIRRTAFLLNIGIAVVLMGGYFLATRSIAALPSQLLRPSFEFSQIAHWPWEILGWALVPAILGLITLLRTPTTRVSSLLLLWFGAWTCFSLVIVAKEPRYFFFSLPPLAFMAVRFGMTDDRPLKLGRDQPRLALLAFLVLVQVVLVRHEWTGRLPTYAGAVSELISRKDADLVLVDAVRDGQFVFDAYRDPSARQRIIPLRASKMLYARASRERYGYQQFVSNGADIVALLDRYGIRYVLIESKLPNTPYVEADPPPRKMLRDLLTSDPRFRLAKSWPLPCDDPAWDGVELRLYEYPGCPPRRSKTIKMAFPSMNREVSLSLP